MKLMFGVMDVGYSDASSGAKTTGDVAEILEGKYHVMGTFYELRKDKIADWVAESLADMIQDISVGKRPNHSPTMAAEQKIEAAFRVFLDVGEMADVVAGLTDSEMQYFMDSTGGFGGAASRGVNHRKKAGYNKNHKARPAFIDSGLYQASFRCWFSGEDWVK